MELLHEMEQRLGKKNRLPLSEQLCPPPQILSRPGLRVCGAQGKKRCAGLHRCMREAAAYEPQGETRWWSSWGTGLKVPPPYQLGVQGERCKRLILWAIWRSPPMVFKLMKTPKLAISDIVSILQFGLNISKYLCWT